MVIARVGVGVFVRRGDPKPVIDTVDAFTLAVRNAKAISYSDPALGGTAANYVGKLMASFDADGSIKAKTKLTPPSKPLQDFVVSGGADFGLTQITEVMPTPGSNWSAHCRPPSKDIPATPRASWRRAATRLRARI